MHVATSSVVSFVGGLAVGAALAVALYETTRVRRKSDDSGNVGRPVQRILSFRKEDGSPADQDLDIYQDDVLVEMFTRNIQFFGAEKQAAVFRSFVVVVGLGVRS